MSTGLPFTGRARWFALWLALGLFATTSARADDVNLAREKYRHATKLFDLGRYGEAAKEFEAAYEAKDDPALLYNIAQAYRLAGENADAVRSYRSFLRRSAHANTSADRKRVADVEARIAELEKLMEQQRKSKEDGPAGIISSGLDAGHRAPTAASSTTSERAAVASAEAAPAINPPPTADTVTPARPGAVPVASGSSARPSKARTLTVVGAALAAAGGAVLVGGIVCAALARSTSDQVTNPAPGSTFDASLESKGKLESSLAVPLLVGGGAIAVTGVALAIVGWKTGRDERAAKPVSFAPVIGGNHVGATLRYDF